MTESLCIDPLAALKDFVFPAKMTVIGSDKADGAVQVLRIVPVNEPVHPGLSLGQTGKGLDG